MKGRRPSEARLYALIALMVLSWASNFVVAKIVLRQLPAPLVAGLRVSMAGMLVWPMYAWRRRRTAASWQASDVPILLLLGVLGIAMNQFFFILGMGRTSVGHASLVVALTPVLVLLSATAIGQERFTRAKLAGMLVAISGVAVLQVVPGRAAGATLLGDMLVFLSCLAFATFTVLGKRVTNQHDSVTMSTFGYLGGGLALLPLMFWEGARISWAAVDAWAWIGVAYMAVFPSVIAYLIFYYALTHIQASRLSAFSYLQPVLATAMAIPALGEKVTFALAAGGALVLTGVYIAGRG